MAHTVGLQVLQGVLAIMNLLQASGSTLNESFPRLQSFNRIGFSQAAEEKGQEKLSFRCSKYHMQSDIIK